MSDKRDSLEVLRGEPIEVVINGQAVKVSRLSIDDQLDVIDVFGAEDNSEASASKKMMVRMVKIISIALGQDLTVESFGSVAEIITCFNLIWKQNEFDFLLQQVAELNKKNLK